MSSETLVQLQTASAAKAGPTRFHLSLNVASLERAIGFFKVFFDREPAKCRPDYAKFELDDPPLVLSLEPFAAQPGGNLNHLGFRMPDSAALVEVQRRLELAGIQMRREEGVECCYARQTKFWVHDPDGNLWEIYTLDEDLEHRGTGQLPGEMFPNGSGATPTVWNHQLGQPFPERLPIEDRVDVAMLKGTFNERLSAAEASRRLSEVKRVLKPGGKVHLHVLTSDRPLGEAKLALPGPAAAVQVVPVDQELLRMLTDAGFNEASFVFRAESPCFRIGAAQLRETRIEARVGDN